jgi:hypothetical protein
MTIRERSTCVTTTKTETLDWASMIFGSYSLTEIKRLTDDALWQKRRVEMLGRDLAWKFCHLNFYLQENGFSYEAKVRVTNYVNALKRGGLIK